MSVGTPWESSGHEQRTGSLYAVHGPSAAYNIDMACAGRLVLKEDEKGGCKVPLSAWHCI